MEAPFLNDSSGKLTAQPSYYTGCNRNKRSITTDIATHEDQALIREMAVLSDVLVENFKAGELKKHSLDYESLHALNHPLIYGPVTALARMVLMPNMQAAT